MSKLINISELTKKLNIVNTSNKKILSHTLRYWEKEFKIIRPKKINNRRYYSSKQVEIIKIIKFLLRNKGMTIAGVKNLLQTKINKLDVQDTDSLKGDYYKLLLKSKTKKILEKLNRIKKYGKKNPS